jgi:hypothetical protein
LLGAIWLLVELCQKLSERGYTLGRVGIARASTAKLARIAVMLFAILSARTQALPMRQLLKLASGRQAGIQ